MQLDQAQFVYQYGLLVSLEIVIYSEYCGRQEI